MSVFLNPLENKKHKTISILTLEDIKLTRSGSPPNKDIIENFLYNVLVSLSNISTSSSEEEICNMMNEIKNDLINPYKQEKWCNNNINRISRILILGFTLFIFFDKKKIKIVKKK